MVRMQYCEANTPELSRMVERIVDERGELPHLYRMLLHSPVVTEGWLGLMTAIRQKTDLPASLREMVIIRIAHLNGASYEASQHQTVALREGVSQERIDALADWRRVEGIFSRSELAALELCDQMTRTVRADPDCWSAIAQDWSPRQIVELVTTIAAYNMVSRVLVAFEIDAAEGCA